jgi:TfoX/Sxy family transcriptional regulator of competence genes
MPYNEALAERIRAALAGEAGITEKKMFGGLAFLHHGLMLVGISGSKLMARVGKDAYVEALSHKHVRKMDFTGKPMQGYVYVEPAGIRTQEQLQFWLERCKQFVATLPVKTSR